MREIIVREPEELVVVHSSMEYDDTAVEVRHDARDVFRVEELGHPSDRGVDVVSFTETEGNPVRGVLRAVAANNRYRFRGGGPGGVAFALAPWHNLLEVIDVRVLAPKAAPYPHGERAVFGPVFETPAGNVVAYLTGHWTTLDRGLPKWEAMTEAMIDNVIRAAVGRRVALWSGDVNRRDNPAPDAFSRAGLRTVWDATGKYPDSYGRPDDGGPIDVIGTFDPDGRVEVVKAYVGKRKGRKADHRKVVARIRINPTRQGRGPSPIEPHHRDADPDDTNPLRP